MHGVLAMHGLLILPGFSANGDMHRISQLLHYRLKIAFVVRLSIHLAQAPYMLSLTLMSYALMDLAMVPAAPPTLQQDKALLGICWESAGNERSSLKTLPEPLSWLWVVS